MFPIGREGFSRKIGLTLDIQTPAEKICGTPKYLKHLLKEYLDVLSNAVDPTILFTKMYVTLECPTMLGSTVCKLVASWPIYMLHVKNIYLHPPSIWAM